MFADNILPAFFHCQGASRWCGLVIIQDSTRCSLEWRWGGFFYRRLFSRCWLGKQIQTDYCATSRSNKVFKAIWTLVSFLWLLRFADQRRRKILDEGQTTLFVMKKKESWINDLRNKLLCSLILWLQVTIHRSYASIRNVFRLPQWIRAWDDRRSSSSGASNWG